MRIFEISCIVLVQLKGIRMQKLFMSLFEKHVIPRCQICEVNGRQKFHVNSLQNPSERIEVWIIPSFAKVRYLIPKELHKYPRFVYDYQEMIIH